MSNEKKFRKLLKEAHREERERVWQRVLEEEEAERANMPEPNLPAPAKPKFSWKKWACVGVGACLVCVAVAALVKFLPHQPVVSSSDGNSSDGGSSDRESSSSPSEAPESEFRYCTSADYESVASNITVKDYALQAQKNWLCFDEWYQTTESLTNYQYRLKKTGEVICYREMIVDPSMGCEINLYITDNKTEIDFLALDESTNSQSEIKGITVEWRSSTDKAFANFEYEGYIYYLKISEPPDNNYVLSLAEQLIG